PFASVDDPATGHLLGPGRQGRRVGSRPRGGFGHRERRPHLTAGERLEETFALFGGGDLVEQVHVALVGGGDVEGHRPDQRVTGFLEHGGPIDHAEAEAPAADGCVWGEDPRCTGLRLQFLAQRVATSGVDVAVELVVHRQNLGVDELPRPLGERPRVVSLLHHRRCTSPTAAATDRALARSLSMSTDPRLVKAGSVTTSRLSYAPPPNLGPAPTAFPALGPPTAARPCGTNSRRRYTTWRYPWPHPRDTAWRSTRPARQRRRPRRSSVAGDPATRRTASDWRAPGCGSHWRPRTPPAAGTCGSAASTPPTRRTVRRGNHRHWPTRPRYAPAAPPSPPPSTPSGCPAWTGSGGRAPAPTSRLPPPAPAYWCRGSPARRTGRGPRPAPGATGKGRNADIPSPSKSWPYCRQRSPAPTTVSDSRDVPTPPAHSGACTPRPRAALPRHVVPHRHEAGWNRATYAVFSATILPLASNTSKCAIVSHTAIILLKSSRAEKVLFRRVQSRCSATSNPLTGASAQTCSYVAANRCSW